MLISDATVSLILLSSLIYYQKIEFCSFLKTENLKNYPYIFINLYFIFKSYTKFRNFFHMEKQGKKKGRRTSRQKKQDFIQARAKQFNILRYQTFDTLKISDRDRSYYIETDENFVQDVEKIAKIRKNKVLNILTSDKKFLTDQDCDEIDYKGRIHRESNIVNTTTKLKFQQVNEYDRCECGCKRGRGDQLPYCTNQQTLNILGPGVLLMFLFKRTIFVVLMMILIVYGVYALTTNLMGSSAQIDEECAKSSYCIYKRRASDQNKETKHFLYVIQFWLGFAFSFIWIVALRFIKYLGKIKNDQVDEKLRSASDYAIKIQNLPTANYSEQQLLDFLDGLWMEVDAANQAKKKARQNFREEEIKSDIVETNHFNMKSIQIIYNMQFSRQMVQQISILCCALENLLLLSDDKKAKNVVRDVEQYRREKTRLKETYELLMDLRKRFLNDAEFRKKLSTSACIIEFNQQRKRKQLLKHFGVQKIGFVTKIQMRIKKFFQKGGKDLIFKGKVLQIQRAPEPSDIIWTNCEKTFKFRRIITIYTITFLMVALSFSVLVGLEYLQNRLKKGKYDDQNVLTIINIAMSVSLLLVNKILWFALFYLLTIEYNHTLTQKIISQMNKVLLASSVNVIALPIISNILINQNLYGSDGLSGMVFDYHIGVIGGLALKLFDPMLLIKKLVIGIKCMRNFTIRFLCGNVVGIQPNKGVKAVNQFYEGQYFDIAENYVYIIGAIIHAAFFCHLQPFIIVLVTIMVLLFYFINRFKILRYCRIPQMTELLVFETALSQAGLVPIMYGAGSLVIAFIQRNTAQRDVQMPYVSSLISIFIGFIGIFNPGGFLNKIVKKIMKNCKCLVVVPGHKKNDSDDEDQQNDIEEQETDKQLQLQQTTEANLHNMKYSEIQQNKKVQKDLLATNDKEKTDRIEVYYENSNSLTLLGFQKILKGQQPKALMGELQNFCQSFFPTNLQYGKKVATGLAYDFFFNKNKINLTNPSPIIIQGKDKKKSNFYKEQHGQEEHITQDKLMDEIKNQSNVFGSLFTSSHGEHTMLQDANGSTQKMIKKMKTQQ